MDAAIKELKEKAKNLDFCAQAPSHHMAQKCQHEQKKCMTSSSDKAKQKACWEGKMKELMAEANRGSGSGASTDVCAITLNMMRGMMKGVKNLKDIPVGKKMEMCKSYKSMGNMMSHLAKCTSYELKAGLMSAKLLCGAKKHGSGSGAKKQTDKHGSGSRGHEDFCKGAPSGLMKVCKASQARCMALKAVAEQKACMDAAIKELNEKAKDLDFCGQAPSHIAQKCQYEQKKCMTISSDKEKQKACWEGKMKELMAEANRGSGSGSSMDVCAIALNAMRDMMKGVKNL